MNDPNYVTWLEQHYKDNLAKQQENEDEDIVEEDDKKVLAAIL